MGIATVTKSDEQPEDKVGVEIVNSGVSSDTYVPKRLPEYVPFGHFNDLRAILESGIFAPVYISGQSGNGKTLMCEQVCALLKREMVLVSFTEETDEDDLIGGFRLKHNGDGDSQTVWEDGPAIVAMKKGAVLVLDEVDLGMLKIMCLQQILAGNPYLIKKTNELVEPAPGFMIIATANTKGRGSFDTRFVGNNILNEAFLDRFSFTIEQEYPSEPTEVSIVNKLFEKYGVDEDEHEKHSINLVKWAGLTRKTFEEDAIDDLISTRRLTHIVKAYAIFRDMKKSIKISLSRFNEEVSKSFYDLYTKTVDENNNDDGNEAEQQKKDTSSNPLDWGFDD
jgi:MoxR-like ATPase